MAIFCIGLAQLKLSEAKKRTFHMVHVMGKSVWCFQPGDKAVGGGPDHFFGRNWFWPDQVFGTGSFIFLLNFSFLTFNAMIKA